MIAEQLLDTGIIQLGRFTEENAYYRLRLEMLSAYPQLLQTVAYRGVQSLIGVSPFDRLVSASDAIPLSSTIALNLGVSLVYSAGRGQAPVHDLVGAYDVGHPACLIVNTITDDTQAFITKAQTVGLEIHSILEVIAIGKQLEGIAQYQIYTLQEIAHELKQKGLIKETFADKLVFT